MVITVEARDMAFLVAALRSLVDDIEEGPPVEGEKSVFSAQSKDWEVRRGTRAW